MEKQTHFQKRNQIFHLYLIFLISPMYGPTPTKAWKINVKNYHLWLISCIFGKQTKYHFYIIFFSQASKYVPSPTKAWKIANRNLALCNRRSKMPTYKFNKPDSHLRFLGVKKLPSLQVTWPLLEKCPYVLFVIKAWPLKRSEFKRM